MTDCCIHVLHLFIRNLIKNFDKKSKAKIEEKGFVFTPQTLIFWWGNCHTYHWLGSYIFHHRIFLNLCMKLDTDKGLSKVTARILKKSGSSKIWANGQNFDFLCCFFLKFFSDKFFGFLWVVRRLCTSLNLAKTTYFGQFWFSKNLEIGSKLAFNWVFFILDPDLN